jgi:ATP-dependent DNA helicase UvrD/PcrA
VYDLLTDPSTAAALTRGVKYVMVDEYQDTNYIQEQLLLKFTAATHNLCVVGDEDQSLYRFRGATVRNILEFTTRVADCTVLKLTTNYRSHRRIVEAYDRWMASADWSNPRGLPFRYDKTIQPDPNAEYPDYPAIFSIWGRDERDEAERFADLVAFLKQSEVIADYSQVALLLHSVRQEHSGRYLAALQTKGIPAFCPRARAYFDNDEVRLMVACFAVLFGYYGAGRGQVHGSALADFADYVDAGIVELGQRYGGTHPLAAALRGFVADIAGLQAGEALDLRPADYFYRLLALDPFAGLVKNENRARNLATLSQLLNTFQTYYHYTVVTYRNREILRGHLFNSFLRLLYEGGINEYEDPDQPFPKGHVHTSGQGIGVSGGRGGLTRQAALDHQAHRPRSAAVLPKAALRTGKPHHAVRPHAAPLCCVLSPRKGAGAHLAHPAQGALCTNLAGPAAVAIRPAGSPRGPAFCAARSHPRETRLQLHGGPQSLRDLSAAIPVLPRVRLYPLALSRDLFWLAGASDD